jgi:hypothetical protein
MEVHKMIKWTEISAFVLFLLGLNWLIEAKGGEEGDTNEQGEWSERSEHGRSDGTTEDDTGGVGKD